MLMMLDVAQALMAYSNGLFAQAGIPPSDLTLASVGTLVQEELHQFFALCYASYPSTAECTKLFNLKIAGRD